MQSEETITSNFVFMRARNSEFNYSTNPTYTDASKIRVKTNSTDEPVSYITTIGLYNDKGQLLMIGKTGSPIKNRNDIDLNFSLKLDLDKPKVSL